MLTPYESGLVADFVVAVKASPLSDEAISKLIGGSPSGPTIRRYRRGVLPKDRIDAETRKGMEAFLTGCNQSGTNGSTDLTRHIETIVCGPGTVGEKERLIEGIGATYRSAALNEEAAAAHERATAARIEAEKARDARRAIVVGEMVEP